MALGFASTVTQLPFTGEMPQSAKELMLPRTGGKVAGYGGKGEVDQRLLMPGYMKDVFGWVFHPFTEAYNKLNGLISTSYETARGEDGLGRPFVDPKAPVLDQVQDRMKYFLGRASPISIRSMMKGSEEGSKIPGWMAGLGFRQPGAYLQDPEGFKAGEENRVSKAFERREQSLQKQSQREGGDYVARKSGQSTQPPVNWGPTPNSGSTAQRKWKPTQKFEHGGPVTSLKRPQKLAAGGYGNEDPHAPPQDVYGPQLPYALNDFVGAMQGLNDTYSINPDNIGNRGDGNVDDRREENYTPPDSIYGQQVDAVGGWQNDAVGLWDMVTGQDPYGGQMAQD